jgi:hypothetical protein
MAHGKYEKTNVARSIDRDSTVLCVSAISQLVKVNGLMSFHAVEPSHSCVLFGATTITVTCAVCTIRGKNGPIQQECLEGGV